VWREHSCHTHKAIWKYWGDYSVKIVAFVFNEKAWYISQEKKTISVLYQMERKGSD